MNKPKLFLLVIVVFFAFSCNNSNQSVENETVVEENIDARIIDKSEDLFPEFELPKSTHLIKSTVENTITVESGSEIFVPDNAFVNSEGNAITGEVTIKYKEIRTPSDIIIEDIDMTFDSAGVTYSFQTAGMFELTASANNEEVFLKDGKNIKVSYVSNRGGDYNFYHYDKKWNYQGISDDNLPLNVVDDKKSAVTPLKPVKVDPNNDLIIDIKTGHKHISELKLYHKLIWKYAGDKNNDEIVKLLSAKIYNPDLKKSNKKGHYIFSFTNKKVMHQLLVAPAFTPKTYKKALKKYDKFVAENTRLVKVKRNINVTELGLMNYDRLYHRRDAIFVNADFVIKKPSGEKEQVQGLPLFHITGDDDIIVRVKEKQNLYFASAMSNKLIAIMPNKKVAIINNQNFANFIDGAEKGQALTFELIELNELINSPEDLNKIISSL
ncbi:MAG: hypothetical protein B6I20_09790 [Bacteroidetes bacterium 4572_117]|nr:MAG: hypothetical protein B6I20_09790 [Bacteroidetes bacterium 4572_117]